MKTGVSQDFRVAHSLRAFLPGFSPSLRVSLSRTPTPGPRIRSRTSLSRQHFFQRRYSSLWDGRREEARSKGNKINCIPRRREEAYFKANRQCSLVETATGSNEWRGGAGGGGRGAREKGRNEESDNTSGGKTGTKSREERDSCH